MNFPTAAAAFLGVASTVTPPVPAPGTVPPAVVSQQHTAEPAASALVAPPAPAPAPAADAKTETIRTGAGPYTVHLASYRSRENAAEGWRKLRHTAAPLATLEPAYRPVDLPGRGAFIRLTAGQFADKATASSFCETIRATVSYCQPVRG